VGLTFHSRAGRNGLYAKIAAAKEVLVQEVARGWIDRHGLSGVLRLMQNS